MACLVAMTSMFLLANLGLALDDARSLGTCSAKGASLLQLRSLQKNTEVGDQTSRTLETPPADIFKTAEGAEEHLNRAVLLDTGRWSKQFVDTVKFFEPCVSLASSLSSEEKCEFKKEIEAGMVAINVGKLQRQKTSKYDNCALGAPPPIADNLAEAKSDFALAMALAEQLPEPELIEFKQWVYDAVKPLMDPEKRGKGKGRKRSGGVSLPFQTYSGSARSQVEHSDVGTFPAKNTKV